MPIRSLLTLFFCFLTYTSSAKTNFDSVAREMVIILQNGHYAKLSFDDQMSEKILNDYIDFLDPQHLYFTQPQIDEIREKYATELDSLILKSGAIKPAKTIYTTFLERVEKRVAFSLAKLEEKNYTFDADQSIQVDREDFPWPANDDEAKKLWNLHVKEAVLSETLRRESIAIRANDLNKEADKYLDEDGDVYDKVRKRYDRILRTFKESDDEDIANYFLSTIAAAYDPHSDYFSKRETDEFRSSIANSLVGIGALLGAKDDGVTIIKGVVINGPADKQGELQLNDRIIGVDPLSNGEMIDIVYMPLNKVVSNIRGKENTKVTLKVEPANGAPGETKLITIKRDTVELKEQMVNGEIYEFNSVDGKAPLKLGWMKIPSFYKDFQNGTTSVAKDVESILKRMNKENIDGLIIDLKGNGGGSLDEVQRITGYFTGAGAVVQVKDSLGQTKSKDSNAKEPIFTKPMIVHIDKTSASASEILAAALQDYNRAVIIGDEHSFGKGTVQTPMEIRRFMKWYQDSSRAGTVKATIQKFYRVSGGSTQLKGVESDIVIPSVMEALEIGERHAKHALNYDEIQASTYTKLDKDSLFIGQLTQNSQMRISKSKDFSYISEDTQKTRERVAKNEISLNIEKRRTEIKDAEESRKERIMEQAKRYKQIQENDDRTFKVHRVSLEDVKAETLPLVQKAIDDTYMRTAKEDLEDLDNTPDLPTMLSPSKRESLYILSDLVDLQNKPATAKVDH